ncbi:MAG: folate family ECF transporter S component [Firmicutes bacterium]|nr:folate family ECF transporter S component [Bacillota bacterium]
MRNSNTARLVTIALLMAMEIILTRFLSISTPILRLGFGFLPIAVIGILYGPLWAGTAYALGDIIGALLFPIGDYFPGFTLTAFLSGFVFGLVLHGHEVTWKRSLLASCIVVLAFDLVLNTLWLSILYGNAFIVLLPTRIIKVAFAIPVETVLIKLVWDRVLAKGNIMPKFVRQ